MGQIADATAVLFTYNAMLNESRACVHRLFSHRGTRLPSLLYYFLATVMIFWLAQKGAFFTLRRPGWCDLFAANDILPLAEGGTVHRRPERRIGVQTGKS
jgi:hypothetical protein